MSAGGKVTPLKVIFVILGTVVLMGVLMYMNLAFEGADVKTAIRLVEEAKPGDFTLKEKLTMYLPLDTRLCEAYAENRFHGHMEVACQDTAQTGHILRWRVNILDGMVVPANEAAERLGTGEDPWLTKP